MNDIIGMHADPPMLVHAPTRCAGYWCCVHNPSTHPLADRPLIWTGLTMARACDHGFVHTDPDAAAYHLRTGRPVPEHVCDWCCHRPVPPPTVW